MAKNNNKELLKVDCNDALRNNLLRLCGVLLPGWAITAPVMFFFSVASMAGLWQYWPVYVTPLIFGTLTVCCARRYFRMDSSTIKFPGLNFKKYRSSDLHKVEVKNKKILFCFGKPTQKFDCDIVKLPIKRMAQEERLRLLRNLDNLSCFIDEESRKLLVANENDEFDPKSESKRILAYDSHSRLRAFREVCAQYEHIFWKTWVYCQLPFLIFISPIVFLIPYLAVLKLAHMDPSKDPLKVALVFTPWINFWGELGKITGQIVGKPIVDVGSWYVQLITYSMVTKAAFALVAAIFIGFFLSMLIKPNRIEITKDGVEVQLRLLMMTFAMRTLAWKDLLSTKLVRQGDGKKVTDQKIVLKSKENLRGWAGGGTELVLSNAAIVKVEHKNLLLKAIESYAPQCEIESGIINNLIPARKHNYTELWLESLNSPPKRERLKPLTKGDSLQSGKFEVKEIIGSGGQGIAYLSSTLNKEGQPESIVIKEFMLPIYVDRRARSQAIERFENEAQVLSGLDNDSIVKLKDHFIEDHRAYLVLEHINGQSLRKLVEQRYAQDDTGLDEETLRDLAAQMCDILSYLHEQATPLVHRDFAPDNLILDASGKLKLIDFNVVHLSGTQKTSATIVGKHAYMPPEQFAGRPCPQSDIYALGASIYYLLTGEDPEPFSQLTLPPTILDRRGNLSRRWQEIISACTNLNLAERAQSATEVKLMLDFVEATPLIPVAAIKE